MGSPLVSIGLPVFNGGAFLSKALESLLRQTHRNIEIVISDNASSDKTQEICGEYARTDGRIRYTRNLANIGMLPNFSRVAELAKGEFFMFASYDDEWEPDFIAELLEPLERDQSIGLAYCNYDWIDERGTRVRVGKAQMLVSARSRVRNAFRFTPSHSVVHNFLLQYFWRNPFPVYGLFRLESLRTVLPFESLFPNGMHTDNVLLLKLMLRSRVVAVDRILFHYRHKDRGAAAQKANLAPGARIHDLYGRTTWEEDRIVHRRARALVRAGPLAAHQRALLFALFPAVAAAKRLELLARAAASKVTRRD
jgi:glycosyltransferase involved in cell wall biosynthesis